MKRIKYDFVCPVCGISGTFYKIKMHCGNCEAISGNEVKMNRRIHIKKKVGIRK